MKRNSFVKTSVCLFILATIGQGSAQALDHENNTESVSILEGQSELSAQTIQSLELRFEREFRIGGDFGETIDGLFIEDWQSLAIPFDLEKWEIIGFYSEWRAKRGRELALIRLGDAGAINEFFARNFDSNSSVSIRLRTQEVLASDEDWEQFSLRKGMPGGGSSLGRLYRLWKEKPLISTEADYGEFEHIYRTAYLSKPNREYDYSVEAERVAREEISQKIEEQLGDSIETLVHPKETELYSSYLSYSQAVAFGSYWNLYHYLRSLFTNTWRATNQGSEAVVTYIENQLDTYERSWMAHLNMQEKGLHPSYSYQAPSAATAAHVRREILKLKPYLTDEQHIAFLERVDHIATNHRSIWELTQKEFAEYQEALTSYQTSSQKQNNLRTIARGEVTAQYANWNQNLSRYFADHYGSDQWNRNFNQTINSLNSAVSQALMQSKETEKARFEGMLSVLSKHFDLQTIDSLIRGTLSFERNQSREQEISNRLKEIETLLANLGVWASQEYQRRHQIRANSVYQRSQSAIRQVAIKWGLDPNIVGVENSFSKPMKDEVNLITRQTPIAAIPSVNEIQLSRRLELEAERAELEQEEGLNELKRLFSFTQEEYGTPTHHLVGNIAELETQVDRLKVELQEVGHLADAIRNKYNAEYQHWADVFKRSPNPRAWKAVSTNINNQMNIELNAIGVVEKESQLALLESELAEEMTKGQDQIQAIEQIKKDYPAVARLRSFLIHLRESANESHYIAAQQATFDRVLATRMLKNDIEALLNHDPFSVELEEVREAQSQMKAYTWDDMIDRSPHLIGARWTVKEDWETRRSQLGKGNDHWRQKYARYILEVNKNHSGYSQSADNVLNELARKAFAEELASYSEWQEFWNIHPLVRDERNRLYNTRSAHIHEARERYRGLLNQQLAELESDIAVDTERLFNLKEWLEKTEDERVGDPLTGTIQEFDYDIEHGQVEPVETVTMLVQRFEKERAEEYDRQVEFLNHKVSELQYRDPLDFENSGAAKGLESVLSNMRWYSSAEGKAYTAKLYDARAGVYIRRALENGELDHLKNDPRFYTDTLDQHGLPILEERIYHFDKLHRALVGSGEVGAQVGISTEPETKVLTLSHTELPISESYSAHHSNTDNSSASHDELRSLSAIDVYQDYFLGLNEIRTTGQDRYNSSYLPDEVLEYLTENTSLWHEVGKKLEVFTDWTYWVKKYGQTNAIPAFILEYLVQVEDRTGIEALIYFLRRDRAGRYDDRNSIGLDTLDLDSLSFDYGDAMARLIEREWRGERQHIAAQNKQRMTSVGLNIQEVMEKARLSIGAYSFESRPHAWEIIDSSVGSNTGFDGVAYRHHETQEIVVSFRGTEPIDKDQFDWPSNWRNLAYDVGQTVNLDLIPRYKLMAEPVLSLLGRSAQGQYRDALAFANRVIEKNGPQVSFTGHSLGGGLAEFVAFRLDKQAYAFNSFGLHESIRLIDPNLDIEKKSHKITRISMSGDPVPFLGRSAAGNSVVLETDVIGRTDLAGRHSLNLLYKVLKQTSIAR